MTFLEEGTKENLRKYGPVSLTSATGKIREKERKVLFEATCKPGISILHRSIQNLTGQ